MSLRDLALAYLEKAAVRKVSGPDSIGVSGPDSWPISLEKQGIEGVRIASGVRTLRPDTLSAPDRAASPDTSDGPDTSDTMQRGVVINLAEHFAKAQRIADAKNRDAARRGQTDRYCRCGEYARFSWPIGGRETWLCDRCEKEPRP